MKRMQCLTGKEFKNTCTMSSIDKDVLKNTPINGLTVKKIKQNTSVETLLITLEKDHVFPEHTSPKDALLIVIEGAILFTIDGDEIQLNKEQLFTFPKEKKHHLKAINDSKILIVR